jgi:CRP-like cAMP-binding protein
MFQKWLTVLATCTLFQGINSEEIKRVLGCFNPRISSYAKNECITVEGEKFNGIGIVLEGEVLVAKENAAGNRVIIEINGPGKLFGEIAAFSGNGVWPATVVAQGACAAMLLPPEKMVNSCERSCANHKLLIMNMLRIISSKAMMLNRKLEYLAIKSMRGKISTFLLEQFQITGKTTFMIPLKRNELADFLNVSRPSLSREMGRMREEGLIDFHQASIKIKDIEALKRMSSG